MSLILRTLAKLISEPQIPHLYNEELFWGQNESTIKLSGENLLRSKCSINVSSYYSLWTRWERERKLLICLFVPHSIALDQPIITSYLNYCSSLHTGLPVSSLWLCSPFSHIERKENLKYKSEHVNHHLKSHCSACTSVWTGFYDWQRPWWSSPWLLLQAYLYYTCPLTYNSTFWNLDNVAALPALLGLQVSRSGLSSHSTPCLSCGTLPIVWPYFTSFTKALFYSSVKFSLYTFTKK